MNTQTEIKLFLLDDHQILIDGIKALLKSEARIVIVGEATRAEAALEMIPNVLPDIVLADINMPGMNGIEFARRLRAQFPDCKVIALSMFNEPGMIREMLDAGASGYLLKNTGRTELLDALNSVMNGGIYLSPEVSSALVQSLSADKSRQEEEQSAHLTPREKEIIRLIAKEYSNKQIAEALSISERTVETHRKNIFRKTRTQSIVGLIRYALTIS